MGKRRYSSIHAASTIGLIQEVSHGHQKNVNAFNAKQAYKNGEIVIPRNIMEQIYHIPSSIKREWSRMSTKEKIVYGTIFTSTVIGLGIAADYKYNDGKNVKFVKDKLFTKGSKAVAPPVGIVDVEKAVVNKTVKPAPQPKPPRNDIKVILGTTDDENVLPDMVHVATYLNQSQKVPNENIKVLNSSEFTYENFLKTVKEVGMNASDNDTIIINPSSDAGNGAFSFSKEGIKFNKTNGGTQDYHPYKLIAEAIRANTNHNTKKLIVINGCYSGSAIPAFKEVGISNSAVYTSTTETALGPATSDLDALLTGSGVPHIDFNKDGKISFKELFLSAKNVTEEYFKNYKPNGMVLPQEEWVIPQIWDPDNITDGLVLVYK
jgi:hypothetical protein